MHFNKQIPNTKSWACMFDFEQYIDSPAKSKCSALSHQLRIIFVAGGIVSLYPIVWQSFDLLLSHTESTLKKPLDTHPKQKSIKIYKLDLIKINLRLLLFGILPKRMKTQPLTGRISAKSRFCQRTCIKNIKKTLKTWKANSVI